MSLAKKSASSWHVNHAYKLLKQSGAEEEKRKTKTKEPVLVTWKQLWQNLCRVVVSKGKKNSQKAKFNAFETWKNFKMSTKFSEGINGKWVHMKKMVLVPRVAICAWRVYISLYKVAWPWKLLNQPRSTLQPNVANGAAPEVGKSDVETVWCWKHMYTASDSIASRGCSEQKPAAAPPCLGMWRNNVAATSDEEVVRLLQNAYGM